MHVTITPALRADSSHGLDTISDLAAGHALGVALPAAARPGRGCDCDCDCDASRPDSGDGRARQCVIHDVRRSKQLFTDTDCRAAQIPSSLSARIPAWSSTRATQTQDAPSSGQMAHSPCEWLEGTCSRKHWLISSGASCSQPEHPCRRLHPRRQQPHLYLPERASTCAHRPHDLARWKLTSPGRVCSQLSVRILDDDIAIQVRPHTPGHLPGDPARVPTLPYPIQLKASGRFEYYESPQGFSILGMLKQNKMILFMVGGLAFAVGMPKLIVR